jgi:gentisate 1,2-dioxygenase
MSTLDCFLVGLANGVATQSYRTNTNAVCVVMEGEGETRVGEETVTWGPKDIFSLPHGQWISHTATSTGARLFQITDRELFRRIDLLRDEFRP